MEHCLETFGDLAAFDALWKARCDRFPALFDMERVREHLDDKDIVSERSIPIGFNDWSANILEYRKSNVVRADVELRDESDPFEDHVHASFQSANAAERWVEQIRENYATDLEVEGDPAPAM